MTMRSRKKQPTIRRDAKPVFSVGNYDVNYAKRNDRFAELDPRLLALHEFQKSARGKKFPPFFDSKDVLDIGCNQGVVTLSVGAFLRARRVVGTDIDLNVIKNALAQLRTIKEHGIHITNELQSSYPSAFVKQRGIPSIFSKPWRLIRDIEYDPSAFDFPYNIEFRAEDILASPIEYLRGTFFDTIVLFNVTQFVHMNNGDQGVQELLRRCYDFLRPGGVLLLERTSTPYQKKRKHATQVMREAILPALEFRPDDFSAYLYQLGFQKKTEVLSPKQYDLQHMIFIYRKPLNAAQLVGQETHLNSTARAAGGSKVGDTNPRGKAPPQNGAGSFTPQQRRRTNSASPRIVSKRPRFNEHEESQARKASLLGELRPSPNPSAQSSSFAMTPGSSFAVADPSPSASCLTLTAAQALPSPAQDHCASQNLSRSASPKLSLSASPTQLLGGLDQSPRAFPPASLDASQHPSRLNTSSDPAPRSSNQSWAKSPPYLPTVLASTHSNQSVSKSPLSSPIGQALMAPQREASVAESTSGLSNNDVVSTHIALKEHREDQPHAVVSDRITPKEHQKDQPQEEHRPLARASNAEPSSGLSNHAFMSERATPEEHGKYQPQEKHRPLTKASDAEPSSGSGNHAVVSDRITPEEHQNDQPQEEHRPLARASNAEPSSGLSNQAFVGERATPGEHEKGQPQEEHRPLARASDAEPSSGLGNHAVVSDRITHEEHQKDQLQEKRRPVARASNAEPSNGLSNHAVVSERATPEEHRKGQPQEEHRPLAKVSDAEPSSGSGNHAVVSDRITPEEHQNDQPQEEHRPLARASNAEPSSGLSNHAFVSERATPEEHGKDQPQEEHCLPARASDAEPSSGLGNYAVPSDRITPEEHQKDQQDQTVSAIPGGEPLIKSGIRTVPSEKDKLEGHSESKAEECETQLTGQSDADPSSGLKWSQK